jgi:hypothetical protein
MLGGVLIDKIIDNLVSTVNYVLFSTTNFSCEGESKIIAIGAFCNLYFTNILDKVVKEGFLKIG